MAFADEALLTIKVNTVCPIELSVGLFVPLRRFCLHDETENFVLPELQGNPVVPVAGTLPPGHRVAGEEECGPPQFRY